MTTEELVARAICGCRICEGEGTIADGLDEAAVSIECPVCFGTGFDIKTIPQALSDAGLVIVPREPTGKMLRNYSNRASHWKSMIATWEKENDQTRRT